MDSQPALDAEPDDDNQTPEYQSLSGAAVLALILGLASPLALAMPALLVVPAAAICVALLAQRKIRDSAGTQTGVAVARWGLALAVLFAAVALTHKPVRDTIYRRQLTQVADRWFNLLAEDRIDDSLKLLSGQATANLRPAPRGPGETAPPEAEILAIVREKLRADPVARCLIGKQAPLEVALISSEGATEMDGGRDAISGQFTITSQGDGTPCRVMVQGVRLLPYVASGQPWRIDRWAEVTDAPAEAR